MRMPRILVIEDEDFILDLLTEMLSYENYQVISANTGEAGLKLAEAELPDLILCDISMTGMDGFAVLKALRTGEKNRQTPVIFLTGQVSPEEIQAGQGLGVNDYLCKPATRQDILAAIYRQLGKRAGGI